MLLMWWNSLSEDLLAKHSYRLSWLCIVRDSVGDDDSA